jgi:hypothetical protein
LPQFEFFLGICEHPTKEAVKGENDTSVSSPVALHNGTVPQRDNRQAEAINDQI